MRAASGLVVFLTLPLVLSGATTGSHGPTLPPAPVLDQAADYLLSKAAANDCLGGDAWGNDWAVMALVAAGRDPHAGEPSLADRVALCQPERRVDRPYLPDLERHILAIVAIGEDPRSFDGTDRIAELRSYFTGVQFLDPASPGGVNDDAWAILALRAAGLPTTDAAIQAAADFVVRAQNADGGWGHITTAPSTVDDTAGMLEALSRAGALDPAVREDAFAFIASSPRDADGCFAIRDDLPPSADTSAWVALGLLAAHADPRAAPWNKNGGPWHCLHARGHNAGDFGGLYRTTQVVLALAAVPHGRVVPDLARPTATLATSAPPRVGEPVDLVADGAAFAGWRSDRGEVVEGARATWWPTHPGAVTFDVLLVDAAGVAGQATFTTEVAPARAAGGTTGGARSLAPPTDGERPTVDVVVPAIAERNVTLGANLSARGANAVVVAVRLAWGDGTDTGWTPRITHTHRYEVLGPVEVTAWARDADGRVSEPVRRTVVVRDAAPRLTLEAPTSVDRLTPFEVRAVATDPDGPPPAISWHLGETQASGVRVNLTVEAPGPHTLVATATDRAGNTVNATAIVFARNRAPTDIEVHPLRVPANATVALAIDARDPEGDAIAFTWRDGNMTAWGPQFHVQTGGPGHHTVHVNASDAYGAWTEVEVVLAVADASEAQPQGSLAVRAHDREATKPVTALPAHPPVHDHPRVTLPAQVTAAPGIAALLEGTADAHASAVEVVMGRNVPVRGTANFTALLPALPLGTYPVQARAVDGEGRWGPWASTTLVVSEEHARPLAQLAVEASPDDEDRHDTSHSLALALATISLVARWRRRR